MTDQQRSSIENGIWVCANCHDWIDHGEGRHLSVEDLVRMKREAEEAARNSLGKHPSTIEVDGTHTAVGEGIVTALHIGSSARNVRIVPGTRVFASGSGAITGTKIGD